MRLIFVVIFLLANLFSSNELVAENMTVDIKLHRADQLRTSDRKEFSRILLSLKPEFDNFTVNQKYFYIFLRGYERAFQGDIEKAIKSYQHVFQSSYDLTLRYRASMALVNVYALTREWSKGFPYLDYINSVYEQIPDSDIRHRSLIYSSIFIMNLNNMI